MQIIRLPKGEWSFDEGKRLGPPGGFGEVFEGLGPSGPVAVKRLMLSAHQAAHRELKIGERLATRTFVNVVPILDCGQDAQSDRYFLVMPVCDRSLQDEIDASGTGLSQERAVLIVQAILNGLQEVSDVTHRDLKPANILLHENAWKIADFGIAKFVEDATSLETLRDSLTPQYAAPEQWRSERPTGATDVYAVGCIVHALLTGRPPFGGDLDEVRAKHLFETPGRLNKLSTLGSNFVGLMLRKAPEARPTLGRCIQVFAQMTADLAPSVRSLSALDEAVRHVEEEAARSEAAKHAQENGRLQRASLAHDAVKALLEIQTRLFAAIKSRSGQVVEEKGILRYGSGKLHMAMPEGAMVDTIVFFDLEDHPHGTSSGWDIVILGNIVVGQILVSGASYRRGASLIFARRQNTDGYRWYEVSFFNPFAADGPEVPFGLTDLSQFREALGPVTSSVQVAFGPTPIDGEDEARFFDRWISLFADAARGKLERPQSLPIR